MLHTSKAFFQKSHFQDTTFPSGAPPLWLLLISLLSPSLLFSLSLSNPQSWKTPELSSSASSCFVYIHSLAFFTEFLALFFFFSFFFNFIFKLYIIVLVLPNIKMNPPQVYMCSPSWTLLPPPSPFHPSESSQCTSPKHPVSCIEPGLATRFLLIF